MPSPKSSLSTGCQQFKTSCATTFNCGEVHQQGRLDSEAWRRDHPEEIPDEPEGPPERMATIEERREHLHLVHVREDVVCAAFEHATSTELG